MKERDTKVQRQMVVALKVEPGATQRAGRDPLDTLENFLFGRQVTRGPCVPGYTVHPDDYKWKEHWN